MNPYGYKSQISSKSMVHENGSNILTVKESIIKPALASFDAQTERYRTQAEAGNDLARVSAYLQEFRRRELTISLSLVIQSVWERQFRSYLEAYGEENPNSGLKGLATGTDLTPAKERYCKVSGVNLSSAPGWKMLELLHILGNVCRHGSGDSLKRLYKRRPDLWQGDVSGASEPTPSMFGLSIPDSMLDDFLVTISVFWEWLFLQSKVGTASHSYQAP